MVRRQVRTDQPAYLYSIERECTAEAFEKTRLAALFD